MTTFNTGNPIGSTDARDRSDNSEFLDEVVNSLDLTKPDRFGRIRDTLEGIYQKSAYYRAGTFDAGYTLTNNRQTLAYGNVEYSWSGAFPKVVSAGSTPAESGGVGVGAWVDRTQETIITEMAKEQSNVILAGSLVRDVAKDCKRRIYASSYGFDGTTTDFKSKLKSFMLEQADKIIDVDIYTSGIAKVSDNTKVTSWGAAKLHPLGDVTLDIDKSPNNQGQILESGNGCTFTGVIIDGLGLKGNGILNDGKTNVTIRLCDLSNGTGQAILDIGGTGGKYFNNDCYKSLHGIQLWLSKTVRVSGNHTYQVMGGIWSAAAQDVLAWGNIVHDCSDVGIDWEGGNNCHSFGNELWACAHGELAVFATGPELVSAGIVMGNLSHKNNNIKRFGTYKDIAGIDTQNNLSDVGGMCVYGMDAALSGPVEICKNTVHVESSTCDAPLSLRALHVRSSSNLHTEYLVIDDNEIFTNHSLAFTINEVQRLQFTNNKFRFKQANPVQHEVKNTHFGEVNGNKFIVEPQLTPQTRMLMLYTDKTMNGGLEVKRNEFKNCGNTPIYVDQYVSNRRVVLGSNDLFSYDQTTHMIGSSTGGIEVNNGAIVYDNQQLAVKIGNNEDFNLSSKSCLLKSECIGFGSVSMQMGGVGPLYRIAIQSNGYSTVSLSAIDAGGAINTGLFPNPARYITFSGSTVTPVDTDSGTTNSAVLCINLNNRY